MPPPIPDWEKQKVLLVDPSIWGTYQKRGNDLRPVYRELPPALESLGIDQHLLKREHHPLDIWIRDWGFVEGHYFRFEPSYAKKAYTQAAVNKAREHLDQYIGCHHPTIPLILDGGNLVHNGKVAIVTEKVLLDNSKLPKVEIEKVIISLGFERVVFIPVEPEDVIGHADGIVRFLGPGVLLVNDYTGTHFSSYRNRLFGCLKRAMNVEIVPFPWFHTDEMNEGVWSAVGCYINFIQMAKGIVVPRFDCRIDDQAAAVLANHTALPVRQVSATPLSRLGGVLNCVSLNY